MSQSPAGSPSERAERVRALAHRHLAERGPLLPILHDVVAHEGWVADEDVDTVANALNLSRADVLGVVSFYHDFRRTPPPTHRVTVCRGEACQSVGSEDLYAAATSGVGARPDVEVAEVFCLGLCATGPSGTVDGRIHGRLTAARIEELTAGWTR